MKSIKKYRELVIIAVVVVIAIAVCVIIMNSTGKKEDELPASTTVAEPTTNGTTACDVEDIEEEVPPDYLEPTAPEEETDDPDEEKMEVFSKISPKVRLVTTMIEGIERDSEGRLHYRSPYGKICMAYIDDSVIVLEGKIVPNSELTPYIHTDECPGDCMHSLTGEMLTHGSVWEAGAVVSIDGVRVIVGE